MTEPEVLKGAEPWYAKGNRTGVLVSHGYTGSPQSMRYLAESLAQAAFSVALEKMLEPADSAAEPV
jgi:carboxylesterase